MRCHAVILVPALQQFFLGRLLVVQTGEGASQAKVFKAHAIPQDMRENMINALKLLVNQQKYGDGPVQNIAAKLCERSRKNLEGLANQQEDGDGAFQSIVTGLCQRSSR